MSDPHQSLLNALTAVFRDHGYEGASLNRLATAAGLGKATLYHHFPGGKSEMANAVVDHAIAELDRRAYRKLRGKGPWRTRLRKFIVGFSRYVDRGTSHCVLAALTVGTAPDPLLARINGETRAWLKALTQLFADSGVPRKEARRRATALLSELYGALALARLRGEPKIYRRSAERLLRDLSTGG